MSSGAACRWCKRSISSGVESKKMVVFRRQPDGTELPECKFEKIEASGPIVGVMHYKCWKVSVPRLLALSGKAPLGASGMAGGAPTAYEIGRMTLNHAELEDLGITEEEARKLTTRGLTDRVFANRQARVFEAAADYLANQERISGLKGQFAIDARVGSAKLDLLAQQMVDIHRDQGLELSMDEARAQVAAYLTSQVRATDPGYQPPAEHDWRDQEVTEIEHLPTPASSDELHRIGMCETDPDEECMSPTTCASEGCQRA